MGKKSVEIPKTSTSSSDARHGGASKSGSYQAVGKPSPVTPTATAATKAAAPATVAPAIDLTHEQIAIRAKAIWESKGRRPGQDKQNWYQAEAELRAELRI